MDTSLFQRPAPPPGSATPSSPPSGSGLTPAPKRRLRLWIMLGIAAAIIVVIAALYGTFLGADLAPRLPFKINGPDTLVAGQSAVVSWDTNPVNQGLFPSEKIEFCRGPFFGERCVTLNPDTTNDGEALVFVPAGVPAGPGWLRLTARNKPSILPGSRLLTNISGTRAATIVAAGTDTAARLGPTTVGGGIVATLGPTGPRAGVPAGVPVSVALPGPRGKVEICQRTGSGDVCRTLAARASGSEATVTIPASFTADRAYIKVSEVGTDNRLTGHVFYRRAVVVEDPPRQVARASGGEEESSGSSRGDSSGDNADDDRSDDANRGQAPDPPPEPYQPYQPSPPVAGVRIEILDPVDGATITGATLPVSAKLTEPPGRKLTCQQWKLDGRVLTSADWVGGNSPDQSDEPCI